ncbi:hypothetical protein EPUS_09171 [Endocarpon pusillum Z07020]|uniref:Uncharacterized protein n=1 Tax=Endocarpon pusillum (strain Z07020 / HMAS-L-300199) TaxID=1263415 RepID=U1GKF8_ENDPU|nr:uncharacterized protein EPUS_09171 [Endocarpon pusillum Z07020]ERF72663.1 hypothetical protein EPUS_09171 [Endocarpon pusillum Z07020]
MTSSPPFPSRREKGPLMKWVSSVASAVFRKKIWREKVASTAAAVGADLADQSSPSPSPAHPLFSSASASASASHLPSFSPSADFRHQPKISPSPSFTGLKTEACTKDLSRASSTEDLEDSKSSGLVAESSPSFAVIDADERKQVLNTLETEAVGVESFSNEARARKEPPPESSSTWANMAAFRGSAVVAARPNMTSTSSKIPAANRNDFPIVDYSGRPTAHSPSTPQGARQASPRSLPQFSQPEEGIYRDTSIPYQVHRKGPVSKISRW